VATNKQYSVVLNPKILYVKSDARKLSTVATSVKTYVVARAQHVAMLNVIKLFHVDMKRVCRVSKTPRSTTSAKAIAKKYWNVATLVPGNAKNNVSVTLQ